MSTSSDPLAPAAPAPRWTLRELPLSARLTLALFLISVGIGYFSALIQLHFQQAQPGELMPTPQDAIRIFHGDTGAAPKSKLVQLIEADPSAKFNGSGQMSAAFFERSSDWKKLVKKRPEDELRKEREAERQVMLAWLNSGPEGVTDTYAKDHFALPADLANAPVSKDYLDKDDQGGFVKIKSLFAERCTRCHMKEGGDDANATAYPLETVEQIAKYNKVEKAGPGISLTKLAQTTHVHLLGFAMLYGLTGLIVALSSLPALIRLPLAPLALLAQVVDIGCWWLARIDGPLGEMFALVIPVSGGVVGASLGLQIILGLFSLFGWFGRFVLVLLIAGAGAGGYVAKEQVIDPYLQTEKPAAKAPADSGS